MIRPIQERDRAWLESKGWQLGKTFAGGYVYVDVCDNPRLAIGGWRVLEAHAVADESFSTPGARDAALSELHDEMERKMMREGYGEGITFFDKVEATCKRLKRRGWDVVTKQVWARKVASNV